jgi:hypothetical protein
MLIDPREQTLFLSGYGDAGMSPDYLSRLVSDYVRLLLMELFIRWEYGYRFCYLYLSHSF